jgi:hypothetical protein
MDNSLWLEYARAYLSIRVGHPVTDWTDVQVLDGFLLLRPPEVTYEQWVLSHRPQAEVKSNEPEPDQSAGLAVMEALAASIDNDQKKAGGTVAPWITIQKESA